MQTIESLTELLRMAHEQIDTTEVRIAELKKKLILDTKNISVGLKIKLVDAQSTLEHMKFKIKKQSKHIAELEKELSIVVAGLFSEDDLAVRDLEQQALACDWVYKNVPDLSNGNYMVIQNRSRQLRAEAKALK